MNELTKKNVEEYVAEMPVYNNPKRINYNKKRKSKLRDIEKKALSGRNCFSVRKETKEYCNRFKAISVEEFEAFTGMYYEHCIDGNEYGRLGIKEARKEIGSPVTAKEEDGKTKYYYKAYTNTVVPVLEDGTIVYGGYRKLDSWNKLEVGKYYTANQLLAQLPDCCQKIDKMRRRYTVIRKNDTIPKKYTKIMEDSRRKTQLYNKCYNDSSVVRTRTKREADELKRNIISVDTYFDDCGDIDDKVTQKVRAYRSNVWIL